MLFIILLVGFISAQFVQELSLINSTEALFAFQVEFYRYCLTLLSSLILVVAVADDYSSRQFENLLSMPIQRWQYLVAQVCAIAVVNVAIVLFAACLLVFQVDFDVAITWLVSMWLELMLCSLLALLAILSLEKIPSAMMLFISLYILSRASPIIIEIIEQSVYYSDGNVVNKSILITFQLIDMILPNAAVFLQSDLFFNLDVSEVNLWAQFLWVLLYGLFIFAVILFDFYRKEFALNRG